MNLITELHAPLINLATKDIALSIIENCSWPLVVLISLYFLRREIKSFLTRLSGFKAGALEIQLSQQLHAQGLTEEQIKLVASLAPDEIDLFLLVSFTESAQFQYITPFPREVFAERLQRLQDVGLLKILNSEEINDPTAPLIRHSLTSLGRRLRHLLLSSSSQLLSTLR